MGDARSSIWLKRVVTRQGAGADGAKMEAFGFANTVLPIVVLLALAVFVPVMTVSPRVNSQAALAQGMAAAGALVLLLAALLFAELYRRVGNDVSGLLMIDPLGTSWFFLSRAVLSGMFWGPVMAFVWFGRALEVERRKGEAKMREGRSP